MSSKLSHHPASSAPPLAPEPLARMKTFAQYKQGKSAIPGHAEVIKLSSNEGCFGASPVAVEAYVAARNQLHRYPDGSQYALRHALAELHGIDGNRIICGNGSEEVIGLIIRCFVGDGDEVLLSENHFVMCSIYGKGQGAKIVLAPEKDFRVDVDAILERITPKTRLISIASPNNPTGTYTTRDELRRLIEGVPKSVVIILDGAYADYVEEDDYDDGMQWAETHSNVVVTRTFSKIYGLAGMRVGWAYGPEAIIEVVNRMRTPFNVSGPSLATATAALADQAHVQRSREHTRKWQVRIQQTLGALGLHVVPSVTNFYLLDFSSLDGKSAADAGRYLEDNGIIPRPGSGDSYLRVTIGNDQENQALLEVLSGYLAD